MTREHKLALIVGFALILVVGVFVSDHFSKARLAKPGDQLAMSSGMPSDRQVQPVAFPQQTPEPAPVAAAPTPPAPERQPAEFVNGERPRLDGGFAGDTSRGVPRTSGGGTVPLNPPSRDLPVAMNVVNVPGEGVVPMGGRDTRQSEEIVSKPPAAPAPALPVSSGELRKHTVAKGDSLAKIAKRYYSDEKLWRKLAEYNSSRVNGQSVNTGVTLMIPPRDVLLGKATLAPEGARKPAAATGREQASTSGSGATTSPRRNELAKTVPSGPTKPEIKPPAPKPVDRSYTVRSGDTLALIAQRELGSGKRWREIQELNAGVLDDDDTITVGMVLKLPARSNKS